MRLAHVLVGDGWGGAEGVACAIARRLEARGHEVAVEATPDCASGARHEQLHLLGSADGAASLRGRPDRWLAWALAARRRVRAFRPDVVHLHLSTPAFAAAAACVAAGAPSIWTFQLLPESSWPMDAMTRLPIAWSLGLVAKTPPAIFVGVSRTDAALLHARFPARDVRCVVNAPPSRAPEPDSVDSAAWGRAQQRLLFVGRLVPQKGVDRLLRALASPKLAGAPFGLLVVGDGPARPGLESLAAGLGLGDRVRFAGARSGIAAMKAAHVVVCPSRYEGMPLAPMEAILAGAAVIASPIAPHRELLADVPECLLPGDERAWAHWLSAFMSDPARQRNLVARQSVLRPRFSLDRAVDEYAAIYDELAGAEPPAGTASRTGCLSLRQLSQNARDACLSFSSTARARP